MIDNISPSYRYRAEVVRVVDGDTFLADIDLGFSVWTRGCRLRLARCNAPEMTSCKAAVGSEEYKAWLETPGCKAKRRLEELLAGAAIIVETQKDRSDKYGRMLATVWAGAPCKKCAGVGRVRDSRGSRVSCDCSEGMRWVNVNEALLRERVVSPY